MMIVIIIMLVRVAIWKKTTTIMSGMPEELKRALELKRKLWVFNSYFVFLLIKG